MAIHYVQAPAAPTVSQVAVARPASGNGRAFDRVLTSVAKDGGSPANAQQAAAEALRMEMMQRSLSLASEGEASTPAGAAGLETLVCSGTPTTCRVVPAEGEAKGNDAAEAAAACNAQPGSSSQGTNFDDLIGKTAAQFLGTPYRFGGEGPGGIDCSSFVQQVFREHQVDLPRTAREQSKMGVDVTGQDLRKGDLIFFHTYASYPSHVGIYLGDGKMIHASSGKGEVTVSDINSSYYRSRFIGARRIA